MDSIFLVYFFILGTLLGSFINVVSLRYNTGLSPLKGRSVCFNCNRILKWYELIPILSFIFLGGKCRSCKTRLPWRYFLVEIITGLLFVGIALHQYNIWLNQGSQFGLFYLIFSFSFYATIFCLLLIITLYDMRHTIIPDCFVYAFIILSLTKSIFLFISVDHFVFNLSNTLNLLSPLILSLPFAFLWFISSGKWIGFGDAKLIFGIGALLGLAEGLSAIIIAFWVGALWSIFLLIRDRLIKLGGEKVGMKTEIPFAPFLIATTIFVFFTGFDVLGLGIIFDMINQ